MRVKVEMNSKGEVKAHRIEIPIQGGSSRTGKPYFQLKRNENRAGVRAVIKHGLRLGCLLPALRFSDRKEYRRRYAHGRGTGRN